MIVFLFYESQLLQDAGVKSLFEMIGKLRAQSMDLDGESGCDAIVDQELFEDLEDDTETPTIDTSSSAANGAPEGEKLADQLLNSMTKEEYDELASVLKEIELLEGRRVCTNGPF